MRTVAVLLLSASVLADEKPNVSLPVVEKVAGTGKQTHPTLDIYLLADGRIRARPKQFAFGLAHLQPDGYATYTLDQLGSALARAKEMYVLQQKRRGRTGVRTVKGAFGGDGEVSCLHVALSIDRRAPMAHVQWLACVLAEQRFYRVWIVVTDAHATPGRLKAFLPTQAAFDEKDIRSLRIDVHGDATVTYRSGERTMTSLDQVAALAKVQVAPNKPLYADLRTDALTPVQAFVSLTARLYTAGVARIAYLREIPGAKLRNVPKLPRVTKYERSELRLDEDSPTLFPSHWD